MSATKVFIGAWWNYSNHVLTLTLKDRDAGILSASLIIFTSFVASQAWNILKFVLHQVRAAGNPQDGYHHHQQLVLRNSAGHTQALWLTIRLAFGWNRRIGAVTAFRRSLLILIISLASLTGWSAARLYLSLIWTAAGDQALVASDRCGWVVPMFDSPIDTAQVWAGYHKDRLDVASTYQTQCYGNRTADCDRFPVPRIDWTASDADCPFADRDLCVFTNSTPIRMDSRYINSNTHLGANAELGNTVEYRKIVTCSPMNLDHAVHVKRANSSRGEYRYYYGHNYALNSSETLNYNAILAEIITGYQIISWGYLPGSKKPPRWQPNATIFDRSDSFMSIYFLSTGLMEYFDPVYDPLFLTKPEPRTDLVSNGTYSPAHPVTVMGCVEEQELCNSAISRDGRCRRFTRATGDNELFSSVHLNPAQIATASRLRVELQTNDMEYIPWMLTQPLIASKTVVPGSQYSQLPKDQWRNEVSRWFDISMIMIQSAFLEFATGPLDPALQSLVSPPDDAEIQRSCGSQRVRNVAGVRNFNLVAILALVFPGLFIVVAGLTLDTVVGWFQGRIKLGDRRRLQWVLDGVFQLQRLAYEAAGVRGWEDTGTSVPTTNQLQFPLINVSDRSYPQLDNSVIQTIPCEPKEAGVSYSRVSTSQ